MDNQHFMMEVEDAHSRSKRLLMKKESEYSEGDDRLVQFHAAGAAQQLPSTMALIGMAAKHFTSIAKMAKSPRSYSLKQWREKTTDLRNYTYLLDALLVDIGVE